MLKNINADALKNLIDFWLAKGITLAIGGQLIADCVQTLLKLLKGTLVDTIDLGMVVKKITENSNCPITMSANSSLSDFLAQFCDMNMRWETLSLAFIAMGRASIDISFFPPLYTSRDQLRVFQLLITSLADKCLDIMLSLDCLNDVQLICQYENWILHSLVDGDQSKNHLYLLKTKIRSLTET